jgi:hypothetical protein
MCLLKNVDSVTSRPALRAIGKDRRSYRDSMLAASLQEFLLFDHSNLTGEREL